MGGRQPAGAEDQGRGRLRAKIIRFALGKRRARVAFGNTGWHQHQSSRRNLSLVVTVILRVENACLVTLCWNQAKREKRRPLCYRQLHDV